MSRDQFGAAGQRVLIEERLTGPNRPSSRSPTASRSLALRPAQDHKRGFDDDPGPNTGGMGAFSPSPLADEALAERA